ncbi:MAG: hypothetical protein ACJ73E_10790, partial [Mycobacteriales bacterium]
VRYAPNQAALVFLQYDQAPGRLINGDSHVKNMTTKKDNRVLITLARRVTNWTLTNIQGVA